MKRSIVVLLVCAVLTALLIAAIVLCACTDTAPTSLRYPLLEDTGTGDWRQVTVGADHTCALKSNGAAFWPATRHRAR